MVKNLPANAGNIKRHGFNPRSGRSPGGVNGNPLQLSLPEFHGQGSMAGDSSGGHKESDMTEVT